MDEGLWELILTKGPNILINTIGMPKEIFWSLLFFMISDFIIGYIALFYRFIYNQHIFRERFDFWIKLTWFDKIGISIFFGNIFFFVVIFLIAGFMAILNIALSTSNSFYSYILTMIFSVVFGIIVMVGAKQIRRHFPILETLIMSLLFFLTSFALILSIGSITIAKWETTQKVISGIIFFIGFLMFAKVTISAFKNIDSLKRTALNYLNNLKNIRRRQLG